ncbi:MAG: DUF6916 family protein [Chloroflexota bacterium]
MPDLETLTLQSFLPLLNQRFAIHLDDGNAYELELIEAAKAGSPAQPEMRQPFALHFVNSRRDAYLPQRIYTLEHPEFGTMEVFLVPLGAEADGMRYEAIFS